MLDVVLVEYVSDAQMVRSIRNRVKDNLTNDHSFIDAQKQYDWFLNLDHSTNILYLYSEGDTQAIVGFGYLRKVKDRWYATLAVEEEFRGKKYGIEIYNHLKNASEDDLWLEIYSDNNPSLRAALAADFKIVDILDKTILLVYRKENG